MGRVLARPPRQIDFFIALREGDSMRALRLMARIDVNKPAQLGELPLQSAIRHLPVVAMPLLAAGARIDARESGGGTALHAAVASDRPELVPALIEAGADLEARSGSGTPLAYAVRRRRPRMVRALLTAGADPNGRFDADERRPVHLAARWARLDVLRALVDAGADARAVTTHGWSALHFAACNRSARRRGRTARLLRELGLRPARARDGSRPADLVRSLTGLSPNEAFGPESAPSAHLRAPELEAAVQAGDAPEAWAVLGDWLAERGDPRGEHIARSLAGTEPEAHDGLLGALRPFALAARSKGAPLPWKAEWRGGFLKRLQLPEPDLPLLQAALGGSQSALLEALEVLSWPRRLELHTLPRHEGLRSLYLRLTMRADLEGLDDRLPALQRLRVEGRVRRISHPGVRDFACSLYDHSGEGRLDLPALEVLGLHHWHQTLPQLLTTLLAEPPEGLRHIEVGHPGNASLPALVETAAWTRLRSARLVCRSRDAVTALSPAWFEHLEAVELVCGPRSPRLSELKRALPQLKITHPEGT